MSEVIFGRSSGMTRASEAEKYLTPEELEFLLPSFFPGGISLLKLLVIATISTVAAIGGAIILIEVCLGLRVSYTVLLVVNALLLIVGGFFSIKSLGVFYGIFPASSEDIRRVMLVCRAYPLAQHIFNSLKHYQRPLSKGLSRDIFRLGMTDQLTQLSDSFFEFPRKETP